MIFLNKGWYNEIKDYNFETGKSTGVTGHFTQLIWLDSKEVGFGAAFNGGFLITVANYFPGGNVNLRTSFAEKIPRLVPHEEKTCQDLFNLDNAKKREIEVLNLIRKKNGVDNLVLDESLSIGGKKLCEERAKTGSIKTANIVNGTKRSTSSIILNLRRGAFYKGGESIKKLYKEYETQKDNKMASLMGKALLIGKYKKVGFGYYFKDSNTLYFFAVFDSF